MEIEKSMGESFPVQCKSKSGQKYAAPLEDNSIDFLNPSVKRARLSGNSTWTYNQPTAITIFAPDGDIVIRVTGSFHTCTSY